MSPPVQLPPGDTTPPLPPQVPLDVHVQEGSLTQQLTCPPVQLPPERIFPPSEGIHCPRSVHAHDSFGNGWFAGGGVPVEPGIRRRSTPITSRMTNEKIIKSKPTTAAVNCSRPCCIASGFPREVIIRYPARIIRRTAIPPAPEIKMPAIRPTNSPGTVEILPRLVSTLTHSPFENWLHGGGGGR